MIKQNEKRSRTERHRINFLNFSHIFHFFSWIIFVHLSSPHLSASSIPLYSKMWWYYYSYKNDCQMLVFPQTYDDISNRSMRIAAP